MAQPQQQYTRPKPEIGQPSFGDTLLYKQRVLEAKQKAGVDTSNDLLELTNLRKKADSEGLSQAIGLFSGGHYEDGLKAINSVGKSRWKMAPDSKPVEGFAIINGQKIPTKILKMVNQDGQERTINTANDMYGMMSLDNMFKHGQKGQELGETERHNKATEDIGRLNADAKLAAAEAKAAKGENRRLLVNDGVKQLDAAYGVRRDPISNMIDPDSIKDKAGYYRDSAIIEQRVKNGEDPMTVAAEMFSGASRKQTMGKIAPPAAAQSSPQAAYPTPWK